MRFNSDRLKTNYSKDQSFIQEILVSTVTLQTFDMAKDSITWQDLL